MSDAGREAADTGSASAAGIPGSDAALRSDGLPQPSAPAATADALFYSRALPALFAIDLTPPAPLDQQALAPPGSEAQTAPFTTADAHWPVAAVDPGRFLNGPAPAPIAPGYAEVERLVAAMATFNVEGAADLGLPRFLPEVAPPVYAAAWRSATPALSGGGSFGG